MFVDNKIIRYFNKNREKIIVVIAIIVFALLLIKTLNKIVGLEQSNNSINTTNSIDKEIKDSRDTILSKEKVSESKAKSNYELINKFVEYCNNDEVDNAYNMLTDECKENVYSEIDMFNKNYIGTVFKERKTIKLQSWIEDSDYSTYLVNYTGDIISTGNYTGETEYQDYITVDKEQNKLNINRYIGRKSLNKEDKIKNIEFKFNYIDIFKDYEIYNITVSNLNDSQIILDNVTSVSSTYIETNKGTKINCSNYEAGINTFTYNSGVSKNIKLKFLKQYNKDIIDGKLVFSKAILNTENVEDIEEITIDL